MKLFGSIRSRKSGYGTEKKPQNAQFKLDSVTTNIECSCLLFEFRSILFRHNFLILGQEDIECVPEKYVLRRWSKMCEGDTTS